MEINNELNWIKYCQFCRKPIDLKQETIGSIQKKMVYHKDCYENKVLNFGTEAQRQDYFKMREDYHVRSKS